MDSNMLISTHQKEIYYATFAEGQRHPLTGEFMHGYYIKLEGPDEETVRYAMFRSFADDWGILYTSKDFNSASCPKGEYASFVGTEFNLPHDKGRNT